MYRNKMNQCIFYISSSTIPSRTANSIHVVKMCNAFVQNNNVVYLAVRGKQRYHKSDDVFKHYGVTNSFNIINIIFLPIPILASIVYGFIAALSAKKVRPDIVYCRDFLGALFAIILGQKVIFESHAPIEQSNNFIASICKKYYSGSF